MKKRSITVFLAVVLAVLLTVLSRGVGSFPSDGTSAAVRQMPRAAAPAGSAERAVIVPETGQVSAGSGAEVPQTGIMTVATVLQPAAEEEDPADSSRVSPGTAGKSSTWNRAAARKRMKEILDSTLSDKDVVLDVEEMNQMPELPTGCESVALTIAFNALGCGLEKTDIAKDYLIRGTDLATSYVGDPFSNGGAGIFPKGLVKTAEAYTEKNKKKIYAFDTTGSEMEDLYKFIQAGSPVIIWSTMFMDDPMLSGAKGEYQWYLNEHCVVMYGYDLSEKTVEISDPLRGLVTRDAEAFGRVYEKAGKCSMVLLGSKAVPRTSRSRIGSHKAADDSVLMQNYSFAQIMQQRGTTAQSAQNSGGSKDKDKEKEKEKEDAAEKQSGNDKKTKETKSSSSSSGPAGGTKTGTGKTAGSSVNSGAGTGTGRQTAAGTADGGNGGTGAASGGGDAGGTADTGGAAGTGSGADTGSGDTGGTAGTGSGADAGGGDVSGGDTGVGDVSGGGDTGGGDVGGGDAVGGADVGGGDVSGGDAGGGDTGGGGDVGGGDVGDGDVSGGDAGGGDVSGGADVGGGDAGGGADVGGGDTGGGDAGGGDTGGGDTGSGESAG